MLGGSDDDKKNDEDDNSKNDDEDGPLGDIMGDMKPDAKSMKIVKENPQGKKEDYDRKGPEGGKYNVTEAIKPVNEQVDGLDGSGYEKAKSEKGVGKNKGNSMDAYQKEWSGSGSFDSSTPEGRKKLAEF